MMAQDKIDNVSNYKALVKRWVNSNDDGEVLNTTIEWIDPPRSPNVVVADLLAQLLSMLRKAIPKQMKGDELNDLDYDAIRKTGDYCKFSQKTAELNKVNILSLSTTDERLAFFVNLYHVMMLHGALLNQGIPLCRYVTSSHQSPPSNHSPL